jgi:phenylalanyl-tRNA synthetase alpha chain
MPAYLAPDQVRRDLAIRDLSDPAQGPHAIQLIIEAAVGELARAWNCEVRWCRGPKIVPVADNYDLLGYASGDVTREARYTRYVDGGSMLRSHSTAMVPPALRALAVESARDMLLVCPGMVYRRDAIDGQHTGTPHQLDLWRISRYLLGPHDLEEMNARLLAALAPGVAHREETRRHPYTRYGRQVDVQTPDGRWVEVWECGVAEPRVLMAAGLGECGGLAVGMGLDRLLMLVKGVPDIRLLRAEDPRIARQMLDLEPYVPVSSMPAIRRDLSVAVAGDDDEETLGDRVRDALGRDAACVEEVTVLSSTGYGVLPTPAVERLGALPGQKNLLVRVVLRDLEKTLTSRQANALRDRIYLALHQGTHQELAS